MHLTTHRHLYGGSKALDLESEERFICSDKISRFFQFTSISPIFLEGMLSPPSPGITDPFPLPRPLLSSHLTEFDVSLILRAAGHLCPMPHTLTNEYFLPGRSISVPPVWCEHRGYRSLYGLTHRQQRGWNKRLCHKERRCPVKEELLSTDLNTTPGLGDFFFF